MTRPFVFRPRGVGLWLNRFAVLGPLMVLHWLADWRREREEARS